MALHKTATEILKSVTTYHHAYRAVFRPMLAARAAPEGAEDAVTRRHATVNYAWRRARGKAWRRVNRMRIIEDTTVPAGEEESL